VATLATPIAKTLSKWLKSLIEDVLATKILARISDFSDEVANFESKYGKEYKAATNDFEESEENFQKYDDLMAWRFAQEGKDYWQNRLKDLGDAL
jgi:hypothetical protein